MEFKVLASGAAVILNAQTVADVRKLGVKAQFFKVRSDEKRQPVSGRFVKPSTQRGVLCVCFGVCFVCAFFSLAAHLSGGSLLPNVALPRSN